MHDAFMLQGQGIPPLASKYQNVFTSGTSGNVTVTDRGEYGLHIALVSGGDSAKTWTPALNASPTLAGVNADGYANLASAYDSSDVESSIISVAWWFSSTLSGNFGSSKTLAFSWNFGIPPIVLNVMYEEFDGAVQSGTPYKTPATYTNNTNMPNNTAVNLSPTSVSGDLIIGGMAQSDQNSHALGWDGYTNLTEVSENSATKSVCTFVEATATGTDQSRTATADASVGFGIDATAVAWFAVKQALLEA